jgi:outer membrane lipoprotein carrier protein
MMNKIKYLLALVFLVTSMHIFAENPSSQLNDLLSHFHSMSANFQQKATAKKTLGKISSGSMALQRPGKFRWEIAQPNHQVIIADGKYLWIYDVDLEQATQQSLTKDTNSPAILLSGSTTAIEHRFAITNFNQTGNKTFFQLKPRQGQEMVQWVELEFINKKLNMMAVVDNLGSKNVFHFTNVRINPNLSPALFVFHAPKGVDIIKNQ